MRIPNQALRCVVYIGEISERGNFFPRGTGFLAVIDHRAPLALYLVTADHVVRKLKDKKNFGIRLNDKEGRAQAYRSPNTLDWWLHPTDSSVDAAVYPWNLGDFPIVAFPTSRFVTDEMIRWKAVSDPGIGIGDETYVVGLFRAQGGKSLITPILRAGHIAMMATEPISTLNYGDAYFHLIETFTTSGLSGSPVFVNETVYIPYVGAPRHQVQGVAVASAVGPSHCLGLVHGFMSLETMVEFAGTSSKDKWHSGITMVVPSQKILEIFDQPKLIQWEQDTDHLAREYKPTEASLSVTKDTNPRKRGLGHAAPRF